MKFTRKKSQQESPILVSSADVSTTFDDDLFLNPSSTGAENNTHNLFSSSSFHTPPSSPIPPGDSPYKTNLLSRRDERRGINDDTTQLSLGRVCSQPNSSPVTCLAAANTSGRKNTWTGDDNEIKPVISTGADVDMPFDGQVHLTLPVNKPPNVCIAESRTHERGVTEPYTESGEEQERAMEDMKRCKSSPALERIHRTSSQDLHTCTKFNRRQSLIRFWTGWTGKKQIPNYKTSETESPYPSGHAGEKSGNQIESFMSSLYVRDNDGRGMIRDDDESIRGKAFDVCVEENDETTATQEVQFNSHCIDDPTSGTANSRKAVRESAIDRLSRIRRRTSILGRLSERNPFSRLSGIVPSGDELRTKNESTMSRQLDPSSPRLKRERSGRLMTFINKMRDRTPDGYFKAGVFDFDCDRQTALQELKNVLERQYNGVVISEEFQEMRIRVPLTTVDRISVLNIIVVAEPQSGGNSRVFLRRGFGYVLSVRSEDFDWFCFDVYRILSQNRAVVRPYYE